MNLVHYLICLTLGVLWYLSESTTFESRASQMEGFMIRVPMKACFPDTSPAWRQRPDATRSIHSRVFYYILEEGYLRGYETPDDSNEPVESFQLTTNRIEVNAMYSLNIFEIKARAVNLRPPQQFVESVSSSDSSDDDKALRVAQTTIQSSPNVINKSYHVVFFVANRDLVKKWSVKLLNWNRHVFEFFDGHNEAEVRMAKLEIIYALQVMNAEQKFRRPIEVPAILQTDTGTADVSTSTLNLSTLASDSNTLTPTETNSAPVVDLADVVKPSDLSTQLPNPWWAASFGRNKKISSYSRGR